jgi:hypothetical protein
LTPEKEKGIAVSASSRLNPGKIDRLSLLRHVLTHPYRPLPDPVYCLPRDLLDALVSALPHWLSEEELTLERQFADFCQPGLCLGFYQGRFIPGDFIQRSPLPSAQSEEIAALCQNSQASVTSQTVSTCLEDYGDVSNAIYQRHEAFVGWLIINPSFRRDLSALKAKWNPFVSKQGRLPNRYLAGLMALGNYRVQGVDRKKQIACGRAFSHFYQQWYLNALLTWDLPVPALGNFGGPAQIGPLLRVSDQPVVQYSPTLRMPDRIRLELFTRQALPSHLAEWQRIINQRQLDHHIGYTRYRRMFRIYFVRDVLLRSVYGDRLHRNTARINRVLIEYIGSIEGQRVSVETIRKIQQQFDRRLRSAASNAKMG